MTNDNFMKEKPAGPLLASMALPMVLSMFVNSLYNIVDSFFVARISEQAMTALSLVYPVQNLINAIAIGFGIGINSQISFYLGAKNMANANRATTHGMLFGIIHGVVITILSIPPISGRLPMSRPRSYMIPNRACTFSAPSSATTRSSRHI